MFEKFMLLAADAAGSAADAAGDAAQQPNTAAMLMQLVIPIAALGLVFYFLIYRPQKKQERQTTEMRNSLMVGDEITTNGGIVGRIVSIKDDTIVIETGSDRNKIRLQKWAIHSVDTKVDAPRENPEELAPPKGGFKVKDVKKTDEDK